MQDYYNLLEELVIWTREAMKKAGGTKAVIGISGGKDSSVTAALMARVLGPENVLGVLMPDGIQSQAAQDQICLSAGFLRPCRALSSLP